MQELSFRQVHLDFHTSEHIPGIGKAFDKTQFQNALREGHVSSITLFSKCHHGWSYHPTKVNRIHPHLEFDLLGAQLDACREIGVNAPVYLSAGHDEKDALAHPEWLHKSKPDSGNDFIGYVGFHLLCFNTAYTDLLAAEVEEVMEQYAPSGIFLDICQPLPCYCNSCLESMRQKNYDPCCPEDVMRFAEEVYARFCQRMCDTVHKHNPKATIFFNGGNIPMGRRDIAGYNTHLELESLPTGGWGYDHFPMSAAYCRTLNMEYLGMTGKFHTTWGEFGGYKHPNALRYETSLSLALGAKCSIGDQLHPEGTLNNSTYRLIGTAYGEVEKKEPYCHHAKAVSDIGVLSAAACSSYTKGRNDKSDIGVNRILLEKKYLYDFIDKNADFSAYSLLILPDHITIEPQLQAKLTQYLIKGGKLLASGDSGLDPEKTKFVLPLGAVYLGKNPSCPSYMRPRQDCGRYTNGCTEYVMYGAGTLIDPQDGVRITADECSSYFNRVPFCFCSHQHAPNLPGAERAGAVLTESTGYISWQLFSDYAEKGSLHLKELADYMISSLLGEKRTLTVTGCPDRGVVTLMRQAAEKRLIQHTLYAHTTVRGKGIEVIEDTVPLHEVSVSIRLPDAPKRVHLAPQGTEIRFSYENGMLHYTLDTVDIHQMAVIELT